MKLRANLLASVLAASAFVATGLACVSGEGPAEDNVLDGRVEVPAPPPEGEGVQFVMPETLIPAGEEKQFCWIPDWVPERDYFVKSFLGYQSGMGHHVVALTSSIPRQAGSTFDCTSLESMISVEPLLVPDSATPGEELEARIMPENFAVRLPAGARLVMQSHYVNVSDQDLKVADVAQLLFVAAEDDFVEASYFTVNHGGIDVPTGEHTTTVSCDVAQRVQLVSLFGHMHDWGSAVKIERERAGAVETLYDVPEWTVEYRDLPPMETYPEADPLVFEPGDKVHVTCSYNNDTGGPLRFPEEMCVAFGAYFPANADGFIVCGN